MSPLSSDANREILQTSTPEESEQSAPIETAVLEGASGGSLPKIPRPETTATPKVNRSS
jgi:hypothetical protein